MTVWPIQHSYLIYRQTDYIYLPGYLQSRLYSLGLSGYPDIFIFQKASQPLGLDFNRSYECYPITISVQKVMEFFKK